MINEALELYLPKYLTPESKQDLIQALKQFPNNIYKRPFYSSYYKEEKTVFQGDCINNLMIVDIPTLNRKIRPCVILSNTCDIDINNTRLAPPRIVYSPLVEMRNYIDLLVKDNITSNQIKTHVEDIKQQRLTQYFYFPSYYGLFPESFISFDSVYSSPNSIIDRETLSQRRWFTLTNFAHYILLVKLSIHFTRFNDRVDRDIYQTKH